MLVPPLGRRPGLAGTVVEVELRGIDGAPATGPEVRALGERLPDWVYLTTYSYRVARVKI